MSKCSSPLFDHFKVRNGTRSSQINQPIGARLVVEIYRCDTGQRLMQSANRPSPLLPVAVLVPDLKPSPSIRQKIMKHYVIKTNIPHSICPCFSNTADSGTVSMKDIGTCHIAQFILLLDDLQ